MMQMLCLYSRRGKKCGGYKYSKHILDAIADLGEVLCITEIVSNLDKPNFEKLYKLFEKLYKLISCKSYYSELSRIL